MNGHGDEIRLQMGRRQPRLATEDDRVPAAVALLLRERDGRLEMLFIERARRTGDPWSGHIAFPGGRVELYDASPRAAAERETMEEVGVDLRTARHLGRLDDLVANTMAVTVAAFVYLLEPPQRLRLNEEVEDAFWIPLDDLLDAARRTHFAFRRGGVEHRHPAIDLLGPNRPLLWGITYRFVSEFLTILDIEE